MSAAALGVLLYISVPATPAAGADSADALAAGAALHGAAHISFDGRATPRLTGGAPACVPVQFPVLAAQYPSIAGSAPGLSAPVEATLSDLLTRLPYAFGGDLGLSSDRARQDEREVLLRNSDALVRGNIRLTLGKRWPLFMYADVGAADSTLKWQGLAGIHSSHGLDLLGGWRHVTYHFRPGMGFDSLDFDGPFLAATLAW